MCAVPKCLFPPGGPESQEDAAALYARGAQRQEREVSSRCGRSLCPLCSAAPPSLPSAASTQAREWTAAFSSDRRKRETSSVRPLKTLPRGLSLFRTLLLPKAFSSFSSKDPPASQGLTPLASATQVAGWPIRALSDVSRIRSAAAFPSRPLVLPLAGSLCPGSWGRQRRGISSPSLILYARRGGEAGCRDRH